MRNAARRDISLLAMIVTATLSACATQNGGLPFPFPFPSQAATPGDSAASTAEKTPEWLTRLNSYREAAGLPAVKENLAYSEGDLRHAQYLVVNRKAIVLGAQMHSEDPGKPLFSAQGLEAARASDVIPPTGASLDADEAIDGWMAAPFHALPMLDPDLKEAGFGLYCEGTECAAALRVGRDESWARAHQVSMAHLDPERKQHDQPGLYEMPVAEHRLSSPVQFPPNGAEITVDSFDGMEWPNPLAGCKGYKPPTGPAITLQLGTEINPEITAHSFSSDGRELDSCVFNALSYRNRDPVQLEAARENLKLRGAIVLIPRSPLKAGSGYDVSITAGDHTYAWSFSVASRAPIMTKPASK